MLGYSSRSSALKLLQDPRGYVALTRAGDCCVGSRRHDGAADPGATRYATFSHGMLRLRHLPCLLDAPLVHASALDAGELPLAVLGWGLKANTRAPRSWARRKSSPSGPPRTASCVRGGTRSRGLVPGFTVDRMGSVFYDARAPSDLGVSSGLVLPAGALEALASASGVRLASAVQPMASRSVFGPRTGRRRVLIVDQTVGDTSIAGSLSSASTFADMLASATPRSSMPSCCTDHGCLAGRMALPDPCTRQGDRPGRPGTSIPVQLLAQVDLVYR